MDNIASFTSATEAPLSRRRALLGLGGGVAVLLASRGLVGAAQDASPHASDPDAGRPYLAIREYELAPGRTMEELTAAVATGFLPIVNQVAGYQEYILVGTEAGVISISIFADQAGAEESTRRAADWVQQNIADMFVGPPAVTTGSVWLQDGGAALAGTPAP